MSFLPRSLAALLAVLVVTGLAAAQSITPSPLVSYPATGVWNTFLSQLNVVECTNYSTSTTGVQVSVRDSAGATIAEPTFAIDGYGTFHLILNALVPADSYGTYLVALPGATEAQAGKIRCLTAVYRFASASAGKQLDYAYALPVMNPLSGTSGGTFNSYNPEGEASPVANWLSIVNTGATALSGSLEIYDQGGTLLDTVAVSGLAPLGRQDLPLGHDSAVNGGRVVGVYRFVPADVSQPYLAFLVRYSTRGSSLNFAFPLFASQGTCSTEPIFASTMNPASNWAEIANLSAEPAEVTLEVRSQGVLVGLESIQLAPFAQEHVSINRFLGTANTGTLQLRCPESGPRRVLLQSMFYGQTNASSPRVEWSYAKQQLGYSAGPNEVLALPVNTYLGMTNWVRVAERDAQNTVLSLETSVAGSTETLRQAASLLAYANSDVPVHEVVPGDRVGGTTVASTTSPRALVGDVIRVLPSTQSSIGTILAIPAAVIPGTHASVTLASVATGLTAPILLTNAGDGSNRLFVVEQGGKIRIIKDGVLHPTPFLDISALVSTDGEQGLLGLAFHPSFASNRRFFVNYTDADGNTHISEYAASIGNPDVADPTEHLVLQVQQPFPNHNGGHLAFGPDGNLFAALGDGGSLGDPQRNAQDLETLLGKLLRINVDGAAPYTIPSDNPFVGKPGRDEIFAYGFRNPWRFSIDLPTGGIFLGDVGQGEREEIDFVTIGGNYGWSVMEGTRCFRPSSNCDRTGKLLPINEYDHSLGIAVTGGYVYRGGAMPKLVGRYFFGDFGSGRVWTLEAKSSGEWQRRQMLRGSGLNISSFGVDEADELYVVGYGGTIYRVQAAD